MSAAMLPNLMILISFIASPASTRARPYDLVAGMVSCLLGIDCLHTLSLIDTLHYTCCYDEIKGTQDLKIYSHADSQILTAVVAGCSAVFCTMDELIQKATGGQQLNQILLAATQSKQLDVLVLMTKTDNQTKRKGLAVFTNTQNIQV